MSVAIRFFRITDYFADKSAHNDNKVYLLKLI